ncbi:hypothetical protein MEO94_29120 [Dolichospermum sp. ST_sed9]|nr:hypothetical protein [Dolichospermum sp. ST_sed9]
MPNSSACEAIIKFYSPKTNPNQNLQLHEKVNVLEIPEDDQSEKTRFEIKLEIPQNKQYKSRELTIKSDKKPKPIKNELVISVIEPDGNMVEFKESSEDNVLNLIYPTNFYKGRNTVKLNKPGTYTIIWKINKQFLTCHQFHINGSKKN